MAFGFTMKISKAAYQKAMKKLAASKKVWHRHNPDPKKRKKRGMSLPAGTRDPATNRDRAVVEMYRLQSRKKDGPIFGYLKGYKVTNGTGLRICTVTSRKSARQGFPGYGPRRPERVHVQATCFGRKYVGSGPGDGMYVRLRPKKGR